MPVEALLARAIMVRLAGQQVDVLKVRFPE
jgi:hypothetical protein